MWFNAVGRISPFETVSESRTITGRGITPMSRQIWKYRKMIYMFANYIGISMHLYVVQIIKANIILSVLCIYNSILSIAFKKFKNMKSSSIIYNIPSSLLPKPCNPYIKKNKVKKYHYIHFHVFLINESKMSLDCWCPNTPPHTTPTPRSTSCPKITTMQILVEGSLHIITLYLLFFKYVSDQILFATCPDAK